MGKINLLDQNTINQIAAGEVIERPSSVVKELTENAIDSGATKITIETKEGGISYIRITDNGCGFAPEDVRVAFQRHATSKIRTAEDLLTVQSLGFRGEALSSIASVAKVELFTKTKSQVMGIHYVMEGGQEILMEEVGCPEGSTLIIRELFYNVPARRKFLKTSATEAGMIAEIMQHIAISEREVSFQLLQNGKVQCFTSGNGKLLDCVYQLYGRDIALSLLALPKYETKTGKGNLIRVEGMIGKPVISRGNRAYENYYINKRYIKHNVINQAVEDAYKPYMMGHRYPYTALFITVDPETIDVNVHPAKLEIRFADTEAVYEAVYQALRNTLANRNLISQVSLSENTEEKSEHTKNRLTAYQRLPEPFENVRNEETAENVTKIAEEDEPKTQTYTVSETEDEPETQVHTVSETEDEPETQMHTAEEPINEPVKKLQNTVTPENERVQPHMVSEQEIHKEQPKYVQEVLPTDLLKEGQRKEFRIIGQLFQTYWLIEMENELFVIDQHAAHEKVLYEKMMRSYQTNSVETQMISPPMIVTLSKVEEAQISEILPILSQFGFSLELFGGNDYAVTEIPNNIPDIAVKELLMELIASKGTEGQKLTPEVLCEKTASMACKAAIKGNSAVSEREAKALLEQLFLLENPYHCPHGRPTTISITKYELEKKFKRII